jgi:hypothetical protein
MDKQTLKFTCLIELARFSKLVPVGYLLNTNNFTLTGRFTDPEVRQAIQKHNATVIETTEKVFSYESVL